MQTTQANSPLVYLNLASHQGRVQVQEDPLVSDLQLHHRADDPRLLKVLGIISGSDRPLAPVRITRLNELAILWLSDNEWLALPAARYGNDLEQALYSAFEDEIALELIPDGTFQLLLSDAAKQQLLQGESHPCSDCDGEPEQSICVRPWATLSSYDLLLSQQYAEQLRHWLKELQH
ncbi:MAG: hypothetical protein OQK12_08690 [Motiliproteus sp.]|nr:hypothetical protein [Motiliproteus sp.]MCW9054329.1 hypothetical protein [Motiliproteus sp.]